MDGPPYRCLGWRDAVILSSTRQGAGIFGAFFMLAAWRAGVLAYRLCKSATQALWPQGRGGSWARKVARSARGGSHGALLLRLCVSVRTLPGTVNARGKINVRTVVRTTTKATRWVA